MRSMFVPGRSATAPVILISFAARLFMGMIFTPSKASNAVWLCPIIGFVICLPLFFSAQRVSKLGNASAWENLMGGVWRPLAGAAGLILGLYLAYDAAVVMRMLANTASIVALSEIPDMFLILPLVLLVLCVLMLDSDTLGNSARIWLLVLPLLFAIMLVVQLKSFEPEWLLPVLGGGMKTIVDGAAHCAGWIAVISLLWWICVPDRGKASLPLLGLAAAAVASILLALLSMLCPTLVDTEFTRAERLQLLLSNGRVELSLQLILIFLWYASLLYLMSAEAYAAVCYLRQTFKWLSGRIIAVASAILIGLLASAGITKDAFVTQISRFLYLGIAGILLLLMLIAFFRKGDKASCSSVNS